MVDDIAVSGRTIQSAAAAVSPSVSAVGLGMLYNSRTTRRLIDVTDVRAACVYQREGGGLPPINSVATLRAVPERLDELAGRYFNNCDAFKNAMRRTDYAR